MWTKLGNGLVPLEKININDLSPGERAYLKARVRLWFALHEYRDQIDHFIDMLEMDWVDTYGNPVEPSSDSLWADKNGEQKDT